MEEKIVLTEKEKKHAYNQIYKNFWNIIYYSGVIGQVEMDMLKNLIVNYFGIKHDFAVPVEFVEGITSNGYYLKLEQRIDVNTKLTRASKDAVASLENIDKLLTNLHHEFSHFQDHMENELRQSGRTFIAGKWRSLLRILESAGCSNSSVYDVCKTFYEVSRSEVFARQKSFIEALGFVNNVEKFAFETLSTLKIKNIISIKTKFLEAEQSETLDVVAATISEDYPDAQLVQVNSVGPLLGKQLFVKSMIAVAIALFVIVIYLTVRFKLDFAIVALLALSHDVIFVMGFFSILGLFCGVTVDSLFITAILTVLGYSVNNTIVVFDRVRENLKFYSKKATYDEIVNISVNQTLTRSINTSLTTLLTLGALYFLGGVTTKDFVLVMIIGVVVGTYSSIFFANSAISFWNHIQESKRNRANELTV